MTPEIDQGDPSTEDWCPKNPSGMSMHEPDWKTLTTSYDGDIYIDVNCRYCGRSGCVGSAATLAKEVCW